VDTGKNERVSRTSLLAHGAAFLVVGFATGLGTRAAADLLDATSTPEATQPRDVFIVAPATDDAPQMLVWVAAELDERPQASAAQIQTLGYRWADDRHAPGGPGHHAPP
jgi:hypothetical protein